MFKITDDFVQALLKDTKDNNVVWLFRYEWDDFTANYKGMRLTLEHSVEKSMRYDRLALGVERDDDVGIYASSLRIDFDGTITSNPAYDLLIDIKNAAIKNHNAIEHPSAA